jgi:hypothetical protein
MVQAAKGLETILMKYNVDIWNAGANENNELPFLTSFSFLIENDPVCQDRLGTTHQKGKLTKKGWRRCVPSSASQVTSTTTRSPGRSSTGPPLTR